MSMLPTFANSILRDDTLDAKWTHPWRDHLPALPLPKELEKWAASRAAALTSSFHLAADRIINAHVLETARAHWLSIAGGADNSTSADEAFDALLKECREAASELDALALEKSSTLDAAPPTGSRLASS